MQFSVSLECLRAPNRPTSLETQENRTATTNEQHRTSLSNSPRPSYTYSIPAMESGRMLGGRWCRSAASKYFVTLDRSVLGIVSEITDLSEHANKNTDMAETYPLCTELQIQTTVERVLHDRMNENYCCSHSYYSVTQQYLPMATRNYAHNVEQKENTCRSWYSELLTTL